LLSEFGTRVRAARMRLAISQEELAHRAGLDRTYVSGVERGRENVTLLSLCRLASALATDPSELVGGLGLPGDAGPSGGLQPSE
jgi:transcriptional regulator with XRE-family HTH domain